VEGATHKQVVDLIKSGGDILTLTVISVTAQEAERLEPSEETAGYNYIDYSEKRSLPISVPDYHYLEKGGERYVVSERTVVSLFSVRSEGFRLDESRTNYLLCNFFALEIVSCSFSVHVYFMRMGFIHP